MKTRLRVPFARRAKLQLDGVKYRLAVHVGRRLRLALDLAARHDDATRRSGHERLTPEDVERIARDYGASLRQSASSQLEVLERERRRLDRELGSNAPSTNRTTLAIRSCIAELERGQITSAINIGCGLDMAFYTLSGLYPKVRFTSVDFTDEHRRLLGRAFPDADRPNWRTITGYALDLLQRGALRGDLVLLSGVASMMTPLEWRAYATELAAFAKTVVLTDVWYAAPNGAPWQVPLPEDVSPSEGVVVAGVHGGCYLHNHRAILEGAGFSVRRCDLVADHSYLLDLVADRTRTSAGVVATSPAA